MVPTQDDQLSLLHIERISQYVSLPPACLATPLPALCASIFSPLLLSYFAPAKGIVLGYEDVQLSATPPAPHTSQSENSSSQSSQDREEQQLLLRHVDEYTAPFLWATASFLIWRPAQNAYLTGRITHQAQTHITLTHLNTFPVSVLSQHLPADWRWHIEETGRMKKGWDGQIADEGGWWVDGEGNKVEEGLLLRVRIRDFDGRMDGRGRGKGVMRMEGSLLSVDEEKRREGKGREKGTSRRGRRGGAEVMEVD